MSRGVVLGFILFAGGCTSEDDRGPIPDAGAPGSSSSAGGAGGTGGAGGGAAECVYPAPVGKPSGTEVGDRVSDVNQWDGYVEGTTLASQSSMISIESYFDCDGKRGSMAC